MLKKHWVLLLNIVILTFLLAKNPFSERTLIPNFEPYPDAIHYIVPARSFVQGGDFTINREGRSIKPTVPPLYSTFLIPFFMINSDPRFFYVANIFLSLGSLVLLYMVLRKYTQSWFFLFVSLFLYSTNYFIYWYPSLAMAENLTLFLFLLNLYIITLPINRVTAALAGIIPFCFFITKYANIPLTITFLFAFGIKLVLDKYIDIKQLKEKKFKTPVLFFGWSIFCTLLILIYTESLPGFAAIGGLFGNLLPHTPSKIGVSSGNGWFSFSYIRTHLPLYVRALFGSFSVKFLWDTTPLLPIFVATPGVIGLFIASRSKKTGLFALTILCALISSVIFMSAFYSFDMRYLYFSIPTLIIGFVLFWDTALAFQLKTKYIPIKKYSHYVLYALLSFLFLFYCATSAVRLKKQVMLNLKYAETPWYYLSVINLN